MPTTKQAQNQTKKNIPPAPPLDSKILNEHQMAQFAALSKVVYRDLTKTKRNPTFYKYTRDQIATFIKDPARNEKALRDAMVYIYNASPHFRRIIQYLAGLSLFQYIVEPHRLDPTTAKPDTVRKQWQRTVNLVSTMDIKAQFPDILTVCLREDTYYGTIWTAADSITLQQLPSDYCTISSIEGNVFNVSFDFSYFNVYSEYLDLYPPEFTTKYRAYQSNTTELRWQELDSPNSFAIKANSEVPSYSIPPFSGILEDIYNLQDYKALQMTKTELENIAMLIVKLGKNKEDNWEIDFDKAIEYVQQIAREVPEEVGVAFSPMQIDKISFDKAGQANDDRILRAEEAIYSSGGVPSNVFNSDSSSSQALQQAIRSDQSMTYGLVKKIEAALNRYLLYQSFSKNFRIKFLDTSRYNVDDCIDRYYKACTVGSSAISLYHAALDIDQNEMQGLLFLESDILGLSDKLVPLKTSHTQSGKGGRPEKDADELTDEGEKSKEGEKNSK